MPVFEIGDVVLVPWPFEDKNGNWHTKPRPALVVDYNGDDIRVIVQITSTNRSDKLPGFWIKKNSDIGKEMGLLTDSFINISAIRDLKTRYIQRKIGECPIIDEVLQEMKKQKLI